MNVTYACTDASASASASASVSGPRNWPVANGMVGGDN